MKPIAKLADHWRNLPATFAALAGVLLLIGLFVLFQNDRNYQAQKQDEVRVQAEILAASVTAALDFGDAAAAQESVDALRVNPQAQAAGVYDQRGALFAAYEREAGALPQSIASRPPHHGGSVEVVVPVVRDGARIGSVYLGNVEEPLSRRLTRYSVVALLIMFAALVVLVVGIAQAALRRANRELEDRARALGAAYERLQIEVTERASAEEQLRQAQKMQALGQLTGGIAHDFNNLLTVIQGSADMLRRAGLTEEKRLRYADAIVQTAARAAALTGQLLAFARRQPLQPEVMDINKRIEGMTELLDRTLGERIRVETQLGDGLCPIEADPTQLESAVLNIAVNARDAMPDGGTLTIRTAPAQLEDGRDAIALSIADSGSGMDSETLARVFEPFFTTKDVGKGTGLGLSQVYGFATQTGGDVQLESSPGEGTSVTLLLPCSQRVSVDEPAEVEATAVSRRGSVLVVDDNEEVGAFAEALLQELGHRVVRAAGGAEALDLARAANFDVVFTDVVMPGMSGLELAERIRHMRPTCAIVLTTGYSDEISASGAGGLPVLYKPYRLDALAQMMETVLSHEEKART